MTENNLRQNNDYPSPCDLCGKGFKCQNEMTSHKPVHTKERPNVCNMFDESFTHKSGAK